MIMNPTDIMELKTGMFENTYVTIDLDIIVDNFRAVQEKAGVPVMVIVKANAYGHGAVPIARQLQGHCAFFGVASMIEALELRKAGISTPILVLGQTPTDAFSIAIREGIRLPIFRYEDAVELSKAAQHLGIEAPFHLVVDTGMSRIGFQVTDEDADICEKISHLPGIVPEGLFSHFATADCADLTKSYIQAEKFDDFYRMLQDRGVQIKLRHIDNSAGIMNFENHYEMVRAGIVIYGMYPSDEVDPTKLKLQPALNWSSRVAYVKVLEAGREVGYGGSFVTTKPTVVATVPVGYADGYRRGLSGKSYVLIHGQPAPVLGRICMDQMMVDVTDIPHVAVGDRVVLIGRDGTNVITMEEIAAKVNSVNYDLACGIGHRVPRFYRKNGEIVHKINYLLDDFA